jgi:small subunit ribosomal protein S9
MAKPTKTIKKPIYTVGRRKRSIARVRLYSGKGETLINDKPILEYFKNFSEAYFFRPFTLTKTEGKYYSTVKISGGGIKGQVDAFIHGISRALVQVEDGKYKKVLKSAGFLTRDSKEKERRKPGFAQSARAKKQSPKR